MEETLTQDKEAVPTGLFDMDGSLADFNAALRRDLEALRSPDEPAIPADLWDQEHLPHIRARMRLIKSQPGWWLTLPAIREGFEVMDIAARIGYRLNILTKGPRAHPTAWAEKVQWCERHVHPRPYDMHITMNKGLVFGTFLYDDYPVYMQQWLAHRPRGLGIMPVTDANRDFRHPQVVNWDGTNGDQVRNALQIAFDRPPRAPLTLPWVR